MVPKLLLITVFYHINQKLTGAALKDPIFPLVLFIICYERRKIEGTDNDCSTRNFNFN